MNLFTLPWVELSVLAPLLGALVVPFTRQTERAWQVALGVTAVSLLASVAAWVSLLSGYAVPDESLSLHLLDRHLLSVDRLSGPLLPMVALLHLLTILTTARVKMRRISFTGHLIGESLRLATFACAEPWPLISLLVLTAIPPYLELLSRKKPTKIFVFHMLLFMGLLVGGWYGTTVGELGWAPILLMAAVLVRSGTFPAHLWVGDLFKNATFGTALLFATPIVGVYAAVRLLLPHSPDWVLQSISVLSQLTALYCAGLAVVQTDARRFFAMLFLSQASLVLIGLELHTTISLTGALGLWISSAISLGGIGLTIRALEARHGRLQLSQYHGLYHQTPALAVGFLLMGLGSVGFPGTMGFIALEVLVNGALEANVTVGVAVIVATALNGIAVMRVYGILFTGAKKHSEIPLPVTIRERLSVLLLSALVLVGGVFPQQFLLDRQAAATNLFPTTKEKPEAPTSH